MRADVPPQERQETIPSDRWRAIEKSIGEAYRRGTGLGMSMTEIESLFRAQGFFPMRVRTSELDSKTLGIHTRFEGCLTLEASGPEANAGAVSLNVLFEVKTEFDGKIHTTKPDREKLLSAFNFVGRSLCKSIIAECADAYLEEFPIPLRTVLSGTAAEACRCGNFVILLQLSDNKSYLQLVILHRDFALGSLPDLAPQPPMPPGA